MTLVITAVRLGETLLMISFLHLCRYRCPGGVAYLFLVRSEQRVPLHRD